MSTLLKKLEYYLRFVSRNHEDEQLLTGCISGALGVIFGMSIAVIAFFWALPPSTVPPALYSLALYFAAVIVPFHFGEFFVATRYRPTVDRGVKAFMLVHSPAYLFASIFALVEFVVEVWLVPADWKCFTVADHPWFITLAAVVTLSLYSVRLIAMAQCGPNFSLLVEDTHRDEHVLVRHGVYQYLRHPSYFGWFWRSATCQLVLMNPVSFVAYIAATLFFFRERIPEEEALLASPEFFGNTYMEYAKTTFIGIPFVTGYSPKVKRE